MFLKFGFPWGRFWPLPTLWCNLHMFLDILEVRIENNKKGLGKTVLKMWSQEFTKKNWFRPYHPPKIMKAFFLV